MSRILGIVGLPNVGKSTVFNGLTAGHAAVSSYPFCTIEPNVGVVEVPDRKVEELGKLVDAEEVTPTTVKFLDIAGLVKGASRGEGLGNKFLSHIREVDAIVHVVRCFEDVQVSHPEGEIDPVRDAELVDLELTLGDLEIVEGRLEAVSRRGGGSGEEKEILESVRANLERGQALRNLSFTEKEYSVLKSCHLLTLKPVIYLANIGEGNLREDGKHVKNLKEWARKEGTAVVTLSAKLEAEIAELEEEEKGAFLREMGLKSSGLEKLIQTSYSLLRLITFYTLVMRKVRAWTVEAGSKVARAAGKIHSDMEKGFIQAEVISFQDLSSSGSWAEAKEKGHIRMEGRNYSVQDGDVLQIHFA